MSGPTVLLIEDEDAFREFAGAFLEEHGYRVVHAASAADGMAQFERESPDLTLLDLNLPDLHGVEVLRKVRAKDPSACVVVLTAYGDAANAVTALKAGASDYLTKPIELSKLLEGVRDALAAREQAPPPAPAEPERTARRARVREAVHKSADVMFGEDPAWLACLERAQQVAESELGTLLLLGESGTGKSHLARLFHSLSSRGSGPFQEVDCPSIPENLIESELFGHERGAFTGANARRKGMVELADGGTLFLDEVGELPLTLQPKLLRFLERRRYRRVGGEKDLESTAQLVCATNRELAEEVHRGTFRRDLFYRLDVVSIRLPALRERGRDVVLLAQRLVEEFATQRGRTVPTLTPAAEEALLTHPFPGNVRELKNLMQRTVAFLKGDVIDRDDLELDTRPTFSAQRPAAPVAGGDAPPQPVRLEDALRAVEAHYVRLALDNAENQRVAGSLLGLDRFALARRRTRMAQLPPTQQVLASAPSWLRAQIGELPRGLPAEGVDLSAVLGRLERQAIDYALEQCEGNRSHAAALLSMSRTSLIRRLQSESPAE